MNLLVFTSPEHREFVGKVLYENGVNTAEIENNAFLYYHEGKFVFETPHADWYDVGISFMYKHRIPKEQLTKPWFNFHPAPLPKYKGRNLCYHAIMSGETKFGATLHYMDENFDTGDIIMVNSFPIDEWETAEDLSKEAISSAKDLFLWYFPRILAGEKFPRIPNVGGIYFKKHPIPEFLEIGDERCEYFFKNEVRAITYGDFYPKIDIGGVRYKIVRDE